MRCLPLCVLLLALLSVAGCDSGVTDSDGRIYAGGILFGIDIALDGDAALVSAVASNDAFLLYHDGRAWSTAARLRASDARVADPAFGSSVALRDGVAVVGSPEFGVHSAPGVYSGDSGAAYVYERAGAGWRETAVLRPDDLSRSAQFGETVATSAGRIAIGAQRDGYDPFDPPSSTAFGSVHLFEKRGGAWVRTARLSNPSPHHFGKAVALQGDRLVAHVAVPAETGFTSQDLLRVYEFDGEGWVETAEITHPDPAGGSFGGRITMDGPVIAVAGFGRLADGSRGANVVYLFRYNGYGWDFEAELRQEDPGPLDSFGLAVAVSGDRVAVGAPGRDGTRGAVFVWAREPSGAWVFEAELRAEGRGPRTRLGESIGLEGDRMLVGAIEIDNERGGAFEFRREGGVWRQVTR